MSRSNKYDDMFRKIILTYLANTEIDNNDIEKHINKMSFAIASSFWDDKALNKEILLLVYGDNDIIDDSDINYNYQYLILSSARKAIEASIKNVLLSEVMKGIKE